jgi:hypothetical protein
MKNPHLAAHIVGLAVSSLATVLCACAGRPESGTATSSSSTGDTEGPGGEDDTASTGSSSSGVADADVSSSTDADSGTTPPDHSVDELVGEWETIAPVDPAHPDHLAVHDDGTAVAETHFIMDGGLWAVRLQVELVASGNGFDAAYVCPPDQNCTPQEFETRCELLGGLLACAPAPSWYHGIELVYRRL